MTASQKEPCAWGGLVVCGKAPINKGETATAEVSDLTYGGNVANDNSGVIRYLRVEYSVLPLTAKRSLMGFLSLVLVVELLLSMYRFMKGLMMASNFLEVL